MSDPSSPSFVRDGLVPIAIGLGIGIVVLASIAFLVPLMFLHRHFLGGGPTIAVQESVASPDRRLAATVYSVSGGGAAGFVYENAVLHEAGTLPDYDSALLADHVCRGVTVRWLDARRLEVSYHHGDGARTHRATSMLGIDIVFRKM